MSRRSSRPLSYFLFLVLLPILFTAIVYIGYLLAEKQFVATGIRNLEKQMNTIVHVISLYDSKHDSDYKTRMEAQARVKEILAGPMKPDGTRDLSKVDVTPGPGDYLFAIDSKGTLLMHPYLEGENLFNQQNSEGRKIVQEIISKPQNSLFYKWQNPNDDSSRSKITVVRYYPKWDWYIGISTYEENFYLLFNQIKFLLLFLVAGSYIITAILFILARRKEKTLRKTTLVTEELAQTNQSILKSLAVALEERDAYTSGHSQRVAYYMKIIATSMGYKEEEIDIIFTGGLLHDIGKIGIEDSILLKAGRLTKTEYESIKNHPVRGEALLRKLYAQSSQQDNDKVKTILTITRSHHERYDGIGYPDQLVSEKIPLVARIAAVADSFDAMTSHRAYRKGFSFSKASNEIISCTGTQFCPEVVQAFLQSITEETFHQAHQITRADEMLLEPIDSPSNEILLPTNKISITKYPV